MQKKLWHEGTEPSRRTRARGQTRRPRWCLLAHGLERLCSSRSSHRMINAPFLVLRARSTCVCGVWTDTTFCKLLMQMPLLFQVKVVVQLCYKLFILFGAGVCIVCSLLFRDDNHHTLNPLFPIQPSSVPNSANEPLTGARPP